MNDLKVTLIGIGTLNENSPHLRHIRLVPYRSFEHRVELVRSVRYVDEVIAEHQWEQKIADVQQHHVDIFVMGSDWQGKFDFLKPYCEVVYLPRTDNVSSTDLKKAIQVFMQLKRDFLD